MTTTITTIGDSPGIMLDAATMELARLKVGDELDATLHAGGVIHLTPVRRMITAEQASAAAKKIMKDYRKVMKRLA